jgi:hypothetical protein
VYSGSSWLADLNFQSVSGLYKNFTRMSPSEFECLINLIGEKISKKGHSVQESHFCSRKVGTDAAFRQILRHFPESTAFHNYQNAQKTAQHYSFAPFKTEPSGMKRRAEERTVVTCHVVGPHLLRP